MNASKKEYIKVRDVMSQDLETIEGLATVADAIQQMKAKNFGALIVNKRDDSDEYGFITVGDIARQVIEKNLSAERIHVYEIMHKPVLSVCGDMNIRYAIRLLDQLNHNRALVTDEGKAVGIITMYDMVMHYMNP